MDSCSSTQRMFKSCESRESAIRKERVVTRCEVRWQQHPAANDKRKTIIGIVDQHAWWFAVASGNFANVLIDARQDNARLLTSKFIACGQEPRMQNVAPSTPGVKDLMQTHDANCEPVNKTCTATAPLEPETRTITS